MLNASLEREGAIAEVRFHVTRGQPVIPSRRAYHLHELEVCIEGVTDLTDRRMLEGLDVERTRFGRLPYLEQKGEYAACQKIVEAVNFLGGKALDEPAAFLVPNARLEGSILVTLGTYVGEGDVRRKGSRTNRLVRRLRWKVSIEIRFCPA